MVAEFQSLPLEIRFKIYDLVFGASTVVLSATRTADDSYPLLPQKSVPLHNTQRSAQLLRVSKEILIEARPILYSKSRFHVIVHAFAGRMPCIVTDGHSAHPHIKHLTWQLDCDLMKHLYPEDLRIDPTALAELESLELRCRAEIWRESFMGEFCDREAFTRGRQQVIEYAQVLRDAMVRGRDDVVTLVEDRSQLGPGRVVLKLERKRKRALQESVSWSCLCAMSCLTTLQEVLLA